MAIKNRVPCLMKRDHEDPRFVRIVKDTVRYSVANKSLFVVDVATGFGKYFKKFTEPVPLPAENLSLMPCGNELGIKNPNLIQFVCTLRGVCHEKMLDELRTWEQDNEKLKTRIEDIKKKINEYVAEIRKEEGKVPLKWKELQEEIKSV